ncbi:hypothetical protein BBAD15_g5588 [Beauveria bassiana D1-5]|uniref:HNH nuclease domain-containing protein n=1 Tax=Beauveria bassiana D1-5 TaxID=1245745 RepID=A0A0A2VMD1_BEABA|nr:hypothetical protein BBAD15_g5588 [Beauveria bassiana D1-5]
MISELKNRLKYMKRLQRNMDGRKRARTRKMTRIAAAYCLVMPIHKLRSLSKDKTRAPGLKKGFRHLERFVILYQTGKLLKRDDDVEVNSTEQSIDPPASEAQEEAISLCLERDNGMCVFTGSSSAEACHIIPRLLHSSGSKIALASSCTKELFPNYPPSTDLTQFPGEVDPLDLSYNMLTLDRILRQRQAAGQVAVQSMGTTADVKGNRFGTIELKLRPLRVRNKWRPNDKFELTIDNLSDMLGQDGSPSSSDAGLQDRDDYPVTDGRSVKIEMLKPFLRHMDMLVRMQHTCLQISAMSGAANACALARAEDFEADFQGSPLFEDILDDSVSENDSRRRVLSWLEDRQE